jgi:hypothetical protein
MKPWKWLIICSLGVLLGCSGGGKDKQFGGRQLPAPKEPPAVPARKDEPLDPALVESARQELVAAAGNNDPVLRENALEALRQVLDPVAATIVQKALDDVERVVRFRAALAAGAHKLAEARPKLESMVADDSDQHLRIAAIYALHRLGVTEYSHDLEQTARSPEPAVRADTAFVLGMLGEKSALKILKVLARDSDPTVRQRAWEGMWRLGDPNYVDELVGLTISKYVDDQMQGLLALAAPRNERVRESVRSGLTSDHVETSLVAARAMGQLGSDEGYGVALAGAKSNDARQRFLAALAFGAIGRSDAQGTLRALMKDKDPRVRVVAAAAVLEIAAAAK